MPLEEYRKKRRFDVTAEPKGKTPRRRVKKLVYVIQKHRASALHYDFRLEWNGVMLSWAVPKGPALDPSIKRLAMPTEDHPIEYNAFEGIIPEGEYGGGTVMIWDRGEWIPENDDVDAALKKGDLKFRLEGEKLQGSWVLVRTRRQGEQRASWLLIKHRDETASTRDIAEEEPRSVVSNRLLVEIARDEGEHGRPWRSAGASPSDARESRDGRRPEEGEEEIRLALQGAQGNVVTGAPTEGARSNICIRTAQCREDRLAVGDEDRLAAAGRAEREPLDGCRPAPANRVLSADIFRPRLTRTSSSSSFSAGGKRSLSSSSAWCPTTSRSTVALDSNASSPPAGGQPDQPLDDDARSTLRRSAARCDREGPCTPGRRSLPRSVHGPRAHG
jgi:DNA ligase D-like protein (predicted 3'-phosphoesterase)